MSGIQSLREHLDRMTQELTQIKKIAIRLEERDKEKTDRAWDDLMAASKKIDSGRLEQRPYIFKVSGQLYINCEKSNGSLEENGKGVK